MESHLCRPHSSCCRRHSLTQRLVLSSVRSTVILTLSFYSHQAPDSPCLERPHGLHGHTGVGPASGTSLGKIQTKATSGTKMVLSLPSLQPHRSLQEARTPPSPPCQYSGPNYTYPLRRMVILEIVTLSKSFSLHFFFLHLFSMHLLWARHIETVPVYTTV